MHTEELIKLIEQKELELKKLLNEIYLLKAELQRKNNNQTVEMSIDEKINYHHH